jgi:peptidyl-prolyl cis-trans isomerase SurA
MDPKLNPDLRARRPLRHRLGLAVIGLAAALAQGPSSAQAAVPDRGPSDKPRADYIVAVVNRELVTAVELARRLELIVGEARRSGGGALPGEEELRRQALESLVEERAILTHARQSGGRIDDLEIDRAVQAIAAQNQLSLSGLRERLSADGIDMTRFRANLRDQLLVERAREREVTARIRIQEWEVDDYLRKAREEREREIELAQIFVAVPEGATAELVEERRRRALSALARVREGESFEAVARAESDDATRERGGSLGRRLASRLPDVFVQAVRGLSPGETAREVLRTRAGFHVLKLLWQQDLDTERLVQTRVRHLLLRPSARLSPQEAEARMDGWRRQIERGERRFEDMAREFSEDGSASLGGDLGWATPGMMVPEFEQAMDRLPVGGLSEPVQSRFGLHLIQVLERREVALDARQERERARAALREQKFELAYRDWVRELRGQAYVELREPPP